MQLKCRDLGKDCDYVAQGNSTEEVIENMMGHVGQEHRDILTQAPAEIENLKNKMKEKITQ